jgi:hypothetical protein
MKYRYLLFGILLKGISPLCSYTVESIAQIFQDGYKYFVNSEKEPVLIPLGMLANCSRIGYNKDTKPYYPEMRKDYVLP